MTRIYTLFLLLVAGTAATSAFAQTEVTLQINHKLGDAVFALQAEAQNNRGERFKVNRLEYYMSEISLVHDGGQVTALEDQYFLVRPSEHRSMYLGNLDLQQLEAIRFHIGVDSAHNHLDPASWPAFHPLAPQNPSMHWGWVGGYRFLAMEGYGGSALDQVFQIHALGDGSYFETEIPLQLSAENGSITIPVDADYARILEDLPVAGGLIIHGEIALTRKSLESCRDLVFTAGLSTNTDNLDGKKYGLEVFPNPASTGSNTQVIVHGEANAHYTLILTDILGRNLWQSASVASGAQSIPIPAQSSGLLLLGLYDGQRQLAVQRILVK